MNRQILGWAFLAIGWVGLTVADEEGPVRRTFRIDLSTRQTLKTQDWSGRAEIDKGRIVKVDKTSGAMDTIQPDMSWTIVYGRSLAKKPKEQPTSKALLITVDAPDHAVLTVKTAGGEFSFRLEDIPEGKKVEAPDEIRRVDIIKNGLHIYTNSPKARSFQTVFRDFEVTPGEAYYYVRVFQRDPEKPDGDSEIAWSSPIFVTYR